MGNRWSLVSLPMHIFGDFSSISKARSRDSGLHPGFGDERYAYQVALALVS